MSIQQILAKNAWKRLVQKPGFTDLSAPAIETTDSFFDFITQYSLPSPTVGDIHNWLGEFTGFERSLKIDHLEEVFAVCHPSFLPLIRETRQFTPPAPNTLKKSKGSRNIQKSSQALGPAYQAKDWDPIASPLRTPPRKRSISISPLQLPPGYQSDLRRAADGLPGKEQKMRAPARSIVLRIREKLCQYAWSAGQRQLDRELSLEGIDGYFTDLKQRLSQRPQGLRWATLRSSAEALLAFARYSGETEDIILHLKSYFRYFETRESGQKALKFFAILREGNTTDRILDLADALLAGVVAEERAKKRHQMRNGAAILAIFANAPLRNASAQLVFGETLFWEHDEWVIRMKIQKTQICRPEMFVFPLHPAAGRVIDELILGDASPVMIPTLRAKMLQQKRQLFVLPDGSPAAATYIPRIFKALTGNSFTTLRVMLYSDAVTHHGIGGIELAKSAAHHASTDIIKKHYLEELVAETAATNFRRRRHQRIEHDRQDYGDLMSALESSADSEADK
jgi:hypothetical protein